MPLPTSLVVKKGSKIRSGSEIPVPLSRKETSTIRPGNSAHDLDAGRPAGLANRVIGVIHDVEKYLLQLMRIAYNLGQRLVQMFDHLNAMTDEVIGTQMNGALQYGVKLDGLALRRHLAGKAE